LPQYSFTEKTQSQTVIREKLQKAFMYKKDARRTLMKLTPDVGSLYLVEHLNTKKFPNFKRIINSKVYVYIRGLKLKVTQVRPCG